MGMDAIYKAIEKAETKTFKGPNGFFVYVVANEDIKATFQRMMKVKNLTCRDVAQTILGNIKDTVTFHQDDWANWFRGWKDYEYDLTYPIHCHVIIFKDGMWGWVPLVKAKVNVHPYYEDGTYHDGWDSEKDYWESIHVSESSMEEEVWATFNEFVYPEMNVVGLREGDSFNVDLSPLFEVKQHRLNGVIRPYIVGSGILEERFIKWVNDIGFLAPDHMKDFTDLAFLWS